MLTKGAIGNLINRYKAVLTKCNLINVFGSLTVFSMLVAGGVEMAYGVERPAENVINSGTQENPFLLSNYYANFEITDDNGGAIQIKSGSVVTGINAIFKNNNAKVANGLDIGKGGAIFNDGNLSLYYTSVGKFIGNSSEKFGGAIHTYFDGITNILPQNDNLISECVVFEENTALHGGALYNSGITNIKNATFGNFEDASKKNYAKSGGVALNNNGNLNFYGKNNFYNNSAEWEGGAFNVQNGCVSFKENSVNLFYKNKIEEGNAFGYGGAISNYSTVVFDSDTRNDFVENKARKNGGAIYNSFINSANFNQQPELFFKKGSINNFERNNAVLGGAIYNEEHCYIYFYENTYNKFSENIASMGGDIYNKGDIFVKNNSIISLDAGYAGSGSIIFENDSIFVVEDASKVIEGSVVSLLLNGADNNGGKTGSLVIQDRAKLKLNKVSAGSTYRIADNFGGIYRDYSTENDCPNAATQIEANSTLKGWNGKENLISDTHLLVDAKTEVIKNPDDSYGIIVKVTEATLSNSDEGSDDGNSSPSGVESVLSGYHPVNALTKLVKTGINVDSDVMGVRFPSRATDTDYLPGGTAPVPQTYVSQTRALLVPSAPADEALLREISIKLVNEVTSASVTAGVQNTALRLADAASENVLNHLSLGNFDSGNSIHADGTDFWATPMYGNTYTSGMSASGASVRGNYGGIAFGADTQVGEVLGGKVRVGAALNGGGGKSETKGTATTPQNDYNFGGINLYAGWNKGNLNVIAGLGYGIGDNEVEMGLPASMKMGTAKADVDTSVITADLRAEYQLKTNWLDILPHAGVRYTALRTDSHDLKVNGSVLNSVDAETQHIVQFPIGVTLTKNIDAWGWNVKPQVDVSVIPAAGDKDMNTKVRFSGVDAVDSIDTRIMDSTSWSGMVGIQASKGNLSFGLNYGIQASSHETDQRVQASIGWKF